MSDPFLDDLLAQGDPTPVPVPQSDDPDLDTILATPETPVSTKLGYSAKEGLRSLVRLPVDAGAMAGAYAAKLAGVSDANNKGALWLADVEREKAARREEAFRGTIPVNSLGGRMVQGALESGPSSIAGAALAAAAAPATATAGTIAAIAAAPSVVQTMAQSLGGDLASGDPNLSQGWTPYGRAPLQGVIEYGGSILKVPGLGRGAETALATAVRGGNAAARPIRQRIADAAVKAPAAEFVQEGLTGGAQRAADAATGGAPTSLSNLAEETLVSGGAGLLMAGGMAPGTIAAGIGPARRAVEQQRIQAQRAAAQQTYDTVDALATQLETGVDPTMLAVGAMSQARAAQAPVAPPTPVDDYQSVLSGAVGNTVALDAQERAQEAQQAQIAQEQQAEAAAAYQAQLADEERVLRAWQAQQDIQEAQAAGPVPDPAGVHYSPVEIAADKAATDDTLRRMEERTRVAEFEREQRAITDGVRTKQEVEAARAKRKADAEEAKARQVQERIVADMADRAEARKQREAEREQRKVAKEAELAEPGPTPEQRQILLDNDYRPNQVKNMRRGLAERIIREKSLAAKPVQAPVAQDTAQDQPAPQPRPADGRVQLGDAGGVSRTPDTVAQRSVAELNQDTPQTREAEHRSKREALAQEYAASATGHTTASKGNVKGGIEKVTVRSPDEFETNVQASERLFDSFGPAPTLPETFTSAADVPKPHPFFQFGDWRDRLSPEAKAEVNAARKVGGKAYLDAKAKYGWTADHNAAAELGVTDARNEKGHIRSNAAVKGGRASMEGTRKYDQWMSIAEKHYGKSSASGEVAGDTGNGDAGSSGQPTAPAQAQSGKRVLRSAIKPRQDFRSYVAGLTDQERADAADTIREMGDGSRDPKGAIGNVQQHLQFVKEKRERQARGTMRAAASPAETINDTDIAAMEHVPVAEQSPAVRSVADALFRAGAEVHVVKGLMEKGAWGVYWKDGKPHIALDADASPQQLVEAATHEAMHMAFDRLSMPERDQVLRAIREAVGDRAYEEAEADARRQEPNAPQEVIEHEIVARFAEKLDIRDLVHQTPTFVGKILDTLSEILDSLRKALGLNPSDAAAIRVVRGVLEHHLDTLDAMYAGTDPTQSSPPLLSAVAAASGPEVRADQDLDVATENDIERRTISVMKWLEVMSHGSDTTAEWFSKFAEWSARNTHMADRMAQSFPRLFPLVEAMKSAAGRAQRVMRVGYQTMKPMSDLSTDSRVKVDKSIMNADGTGAKADTSAMSAAEKKAVDAFYATRDMGMRSSLRPKWAMLAGQEPAPGAEFDTRALHAEIDAHEADVARVTQEAAELARISRIKDPIRRQDALNAFGTQDEIDAVIEARAALKADTPRISQLRALVRIVDEFAELSTTGYVPHYWPQGRYAVVAINDATGKAVRREVVPSARAARKMEAAFKADGITVRTYSADRQHDVAKRAGLGVGTPEIAQVLQDFVESPHVMAALGIDKAQAKAAYEEYLNLNGRDGGRTGTAGFIDDPELIAARIVGNAAHAEARASVMEQAVPLLRELRGRDDVSREFALQDLDTQQKRIDAMRALGEITAEQFQAMRDEAKVRRDMVEAKARPKLAGWVDRYVDDNLNQSIPVVVQKTRMYATLLALSWRMSSALVQAPQVLLQGVPMALAIGGRKAAGRAIVESKGLWRALEIAPKILVNPDAEVLRGIFTRIRKTDQELGDAMLANLDVGRSFQLPGTAEFRDLADAAKLGRERKGVANKVAGVPRAVLERGMFAFGGVDSAVRIANFTVGFKMARAMDAKGWKTARTMGYHGPQTPAAFAAWYGDKTSFLMGKAASTELMRTKLGSLFTGLKSAGFNTWDNYGLMLRAARDADAETRGQIYAGIAAQAAAHTLSAGIASTIPFVLLSYAINAALKFGDKDDKGQPATWETLLYRKFGEDSKLARFLSQGSLGLITGSGNLGSRLNWANNVIPTSLDFTQSSTVLGLGQKIYDTGGEIVSSALDASIDGRWAAAAGKASMAVATMPTIGKDLSKAASILQGRGVQTNTGTARGAAKGYGIGAAAAAAAGFQPGGQYTASVQAGVNADVARDNDRATRLFRERMTRAYAENNAAEKAKIRQEMIAYNLKAKTSEKVSIDSIITSAKRRQKQAGAGAEDASLQSKQVRRALAEEDTERQEP